MKTFTPRLQLTLTFLTLLFSLALLRGQSTEKSITPNIVPNPDFEQYSNAPIGWFYKGKHFTDVMKFWTSPTGASPDVFGPKVRVPSHWKDKGFGNQSPQNGNSMVGITCYGCTDGKPHCREYLQIHLNEPLVPGQTYYVEMWVSHLPNSLQINNLGAAFVEEKIQIPTDEILLFDPQIRAKKIISAPRHKWLKLAGRFKANTEAEFMIIGNFFPDSLTITSQPPDALNYAYYYIDDVLVRKEEPIIKVPVKEDDLTKVVLEEGKIIQLKDIFFETDKYELLPRSYIELNKLLILMQENPKMVIEIRGHTDSRGDDQYNLYLSRKRAQAVVNFLNENGIDDKRTLYKGYGASAPIASNTNDKGRQLNRRVEFKIIKK